MAFELLTGRPPYVDDNLVRLISKHVTAPIPPLEARMNCPAGIERWLQGLLAKQPGERFRSAPAAARALVELGDFPADSPIGSQASRTQPLPSALAETELVSATLPLLGTIRRTTDIAPRELNETDETVRLPEIEAPTLPGGALDTRPQSTELPADWRVGDLRATSERFLSGLGLFGLREVPFVGRTTLRDSLWKHLREVIDTSHPHAVVLRGAAGTGKSRLAEWFIRRARECDAATVLRVHHHPEDSPDSGIARMLTRHFRIWGLDDDKALARIRGQLQLLGSMETPDLLDHDARLLLQIARPDIELARHTARKEMLAALARWLTWTADAHPMLIWFDDAQWATEALELTRAVLDNRRSHRVMAVLTVRDGAGGRHQRELIEHIGASDRSTTYEVGPLDTVERRQLLRAVLPLDDALVDRVAKRTQGHPLFSVHLISAWVEEQALVAADRGYRLQSDEPLPGDAAEICRRRLRNLFTEAPVGAPREARRRAVELAACLGNEPRRDDWECACRAAGITIDLDRLVASMTERGIVRSSERDWRFAHGQFRQSALTLARQQGRLRDNHRFCARGLESSPSSATEEWHYHYARHLVEAGELEAALAPLMQAFVNSRHVGQFDKAEALLQRHRTILEELGAAPNDERMLQNTLEASHLAVDRGTLTDAREILSDSAHVFDGAPAELIAERWAVLGLLSIFDGHPSTALTYFDKVGDIGGQPRDSAARVLIWKADTLRMLGRLEEALEASLESIRICTAPDADPVSIAPTLSGALAGAAYLSKQLGRLDEAEAYVERGLDLWRDHPSPSGFDLAEHWNALGEILRADGKPDRALPHYERARLLYERNLAPMHAAVVNINVGIALVELARWQEAVTILRSAASTLDEMTDPSNAAMARTVLGLAAATLGDWEMWARDVRPGLEWLLENEVVEVENAEYAARAAAAARRAGRMDEADLAERVARDQRSQLEPSQLEPSQLEPSQLEPSQLEPSQLEPSQLEPSK
jgi:tetratricopeptide (TPR) repeat protein